MPAEGASASTAADFTPANAPFGSNATGANVAAGQFNYLLLYEGAPTGGAIPSGTPTVRMQLGPDIDMAGNVINNAMGPFPDRYRSQRPGTVRRAPTPSPRRARSTSP